MVLRMTFTLTRGDAIEEGVFGTLTNGTDTYCTLERTWDGLPKIPVGTYICLRGMHRLEGMQNDFECFELQNVPGHTGCLIHIANYPHDLNGCIGIGLRHDGTMLYSSRTAFTYFMASLDGVDSFELTVD